MSTFFRAFTIRMGFVLVCFALWLPLPPEAQALRSGEINPLSAGARIPDVSLRTADGAAVNLRALLSREGPAVILFYRGGWCPYCNRQLADMQGVSSQLRAMGVQLLAISPDRPEKLRESATRLSLTYRLLSDSNASAMRGFGVASRMAPEQVARYRNQYGIDIEGDSGASHHLLPVPAVFLVDRSGQVVYGQFNTDYKSTISGKEVLTKVQSLFFVQR